MIDYDMIRKLAERVEKDGGVILTPDTTLRLLRIIEIAKASLMNIITVGDAPVAEYARRVLDEIAKIENEE